MKDGDWRWPTKCSPDLNWMWHSWIQPFWCQDHLASKNMSTNIADKGQFNILYHLSVVLKEVAQITLLFKKADMLIKLRTRLRVNITLLLTLSVTLTQTSLLWMMKRNAVQKSGVCPDHPSRLIHPFNDGLVPTSPQTHNYSIHWTKCYWLLFISSSIYLHKMYAIGVSTAWWDK